MLQSSWARAVLKDARVVSLPSLTQLNTFPKPLHILYILLLRGAFHDKLHSSHPAVADMLYDAKFCEARSYKCYMSLAYELSSPVSVVYVITCVAAWLDSPSEHKKGNCIGQQKLNLGWLKCSAFPFIYNQMDVFTYMPLRLDTGSLRNREKGVENILKCLGHLFQPVTMW